MTCQDKNDLHHGIQFQSKNINSLNLLLTH